jgi:hypothetical protein
MVQLSSIFSQLVTMFCARTSSVQLRAAKEFDWRTQFVSMLCAKSGRAHSLREMCEGLASVEGVLQHL